MALTLVAPEAPPTASASALFGFEAAKDHRRIVRLAAYPSGEGTTLVALEVHPVSVVAEVEVQHLEVRFDTTEEAQRFADETLTALEYLGCTVTSRS